MKSLAWGSIVVLYKMDLKRCLKMLVLRKHHTAVFDFCFYLPVKREPHQISGQLCKNHRNMKSCYT